MEKNTTIVAGFWRRISAFLIDAIILGIFLNILALIIKDFAFRIGPYGRLIGWPIVLIYFSVFNSNIGKGQTPGKRLLKISLCNYQGQRISLAHSLVRTTIFSLPMLFNQWSIPLLVSNPLFLALAVVIVFGIGGSIVYLIIFNRKTRQGLHDIISKTYVIKNSKEIFNQLPKIPKLHLIVSTIIIILSLGLNFSSSLFKSKTIMGINLKNLDVLYKSLSSDKRFFNVSVFDQKFHSLGQKTPARVLKVSGWYKGTSSSEERKQCVYDFAQIVMNTYSDIADIDYLSISISSGYDLLFASGYLYNNNSKTITEWKEILKKP